MKGAASCAPQATTAIATRGNGLHDLMPRWYLVTGSLSNGGRADDPRAPAKTAHRRNSVAPILDSQKP